MGFVGLWKNPRGPSVLPVLGSVGYAGGEQAPGLGQCR